MVIASAKVIVIVGIMAKARARETAADMAVAIGTLMAMAIVATTTIGYRWS